MNLINRILHRILHEKQDYDPLDERIVWGIWAPKRLKLGYKLMAINLRVPISVLVGDVLSQWLAQNGETLLSDEEKRLRHGDYLAKKYLAPEK